MNLLSARARLMLGGLVVLLTGLGGFALLTLPQDGLDGRAVDANATITARSDTADARYATVQFATATGAPAAATIAICHHQSYDIGNAVAIRYDSATPSRAYERDMAPVAPPVAGFALMLALGLGLAIVAQHRRRPPTVAVEQAVTGEDLDAELAALLKDADPELVDACASGLHSHAGTSFAGLRT